MILTTEGGCDVADAVEEVAVAKLTGDDQSAEVEAASVGRFRLVNVVHHLGQKNRLKRGEGRSAESPGGQQGGKISG